ncbi:MAG TPA: hypothetical protein VHS53_12365 [Mucilaginibacter sp.]|nr:hypothetical protein [Mucilaginibacter sp.]
MRKLITLITVLSFFSIANAQVRGFGNIDTADLKSTSCVFEKDAHAEVLFDRSGLYFSTAGYLNMERHPRIKIFNEKDNDFGTVSTEYDKILSEYSKDSYPILKYF